LELDLPAPQGMRPIRGQPAPRGHKVHRGFQGLHVIREQQGQPVLLEQVPPVLLVLVARVPQVDRVLPVPLVQMVALVQPAIPVQQGVEVPQALRDKVEILVHKVTQAQQAPQVLQVARALRDPQGKQV
jgi:hypothetical protein